MASGATEQAQELTFGYVVHVCAGTPELVAEFDRLAGTHLATVGRRAPINAMIDEASGRDAEACRAFLEFVWDCVWIRLPRDEAGRVLP